MHFLNSLSAALGNVLARYGGWGLFAVSFLDGSALGLPLINDLLLIELSMQHPARMPCSQPGDLCSVRTRFTLS